jgi:Protein of unknown function (DUF2380)
LAKKEAAVRDLTMVEVALTAVLALATVAHAATRTVAVFEFEFADTSLEGETNGPRADEQARLARLGGELRGRLAQSGRFSVVDIAPVAAQARSSNLQACGGCDAGFAQVLGAEFSVTGWVQKVSNLILNMNIAVRDAQTARLVASMSVDMRGNTDETWSRALDWLIRNRLLAPDRAVLR